MPSQQFVCFLTPSSFAPLCTGLGTLYDFLHEHINELDWATRITLAIDIANGECVCVCAGVCLSVSLCVSVCSCVSVFARVWVHVRVCRCVCDNARYVLVYCS